MLNIIEIELNNYFYRFGALLYLRNVSSKITKCYLFEF